MRFLCSDIHGDFDKYQKALDIVGDDDLIIIGDVIDRGDEGFRILLDTMNRDNVTLMMGNHEAMMAESIFGKGLYGDAWLSPNNGGETTARAFMRAVKKKEIDEEALEDYLVHLPVSIDFGDYYLVHGQPVLGSRSEPATLDNPIIRTMDDYPRSELKQCLWGSCFEVGVGPRAFNRIQKARGRQTTYFVGHVMTQYVTQYTSYSDARMVDKGDGRILTISADDGSVMYDLDGGCAMKSELSYLILYCLDLDEVILIR